MPTFPASRAPNRFVQRGFTMVELMVTLSVLAVIAFAAAPSFSGVMSTQRTRNAALDLSSALTLARSEAVKRNLTVTVATAGTWASGWSVSAGAEKVRGFGPYDGIAIASSGGNSLSLGNDGRPLNGSATFQVAPSVSPQTGSTICVQLSGTGRVALVSGTCS